MTDPIEKIARAICMAGMTAEDAEDWEPEKCGNREEHLEQARAAFAATVEELKPWLEHPLSCSVWQRDYEREGTVIRKPDEHCDCGLSAALAGGTNATEEGQSNEA